MRRVILLFVVLILFTGIMSFTGCSTVPKVPQTYMVPYDPANPYDGTWLWIKVGAIEKSIKADEILVIRGTEGTTYRPETKMIIFSNMAKTGERVINEGFKNLFVLSDNDNTMRAITETGTISSTYKRLQSLK